MHSANEFDKNQVFLNINVNELDRTATMVLTHLDENGTGRYYINVFFAPGS